MMYWAEWKMPEGRPGCWDEAAAASPGEQPGYSTRTKPVTSGRRPGGPDGAATAEALLGRQPGQQDKMRRPRRGGPSEALSGRRPGWRDWWTNRIER